MLIVGLSWFVFWLLINVFTMAIDKAALVTALIFIILGVVLEGRPVIDKYITKP